MFRLVRVRSRGGLYHKFYKKSIFIVKNLLKFKDFDGLWLRLLRGPGPIPRVYSANHCMGFRNGKQGHGWEGYPPGEDISYKQLPLPSEVRPLQKRFKASDAVLVGQFCGVLMQL